MIAPALVASYSNNLHLGEVLPPLFATVAYLTLYTRRLRTLAAEGRPVATWRVYCFVAGVLTVLGVQIGPADNLADSLLVAHMAQHILIGDIASLMIVLGLTGPVLQPLLQIRLTRPIRVLVSPLVALVLWAADLYAWHIPFFYQAAINHDLVHSLEHACMLWFGCLLWLAPDRSAPEARVDAGMGSARIRHRRPPAGRDPRQRPDLGPDASITRCTACGTPPAASPRCRIRTSRAG